MHTPNSQPPPPPSPQSRQHTTSCPPSFTISPQFPQFPLPPRNTRSCPPSFRMNPQSPSFVQNAQIHPTPSPQERLPPAQTSTLNPRVQSFTPSVEPQTTDGATADEATADNLPYATASPYYYATSPVYPHMSQPPMNQSHFDQRPYVQPYGFDHPLRPNGEVEDNRSYNLAFYNQIENINTARNFLEYEGQTLPRNPYQVGQEPDWQ
ncbi:unnamed protein product [Periconia digitata]|uniref:Uncharacterized protein n=1 Tax=Periconia digitata TaxID=1303443 RepID=A0A9W4UA72_9PLEO|nr:unnamed protein product [Periconia digitata]